MNILHLVQKPQLRGAEVFTAQLASHLEQKGHHAHIVYIFPGEAELPFTGKTSHLEGNKKSRLFDFKAWKKLATIIEEEKPDVVQANAGDTLKYAVFSKLFFRWKQPIIFRNASTISLYIKSSIAKAWNRFLFRYADQIVSVSNTSAADFVTLFPECKSRTVTIPIGIQESTYSNGTLNGIGNNDQRNGPLLIHVGGFSFEKNHSGLLSIFEKFLQQSPSATLQLVGDGPLKKQTEELASQKGFGDKIKFLGMRKNAMELIKNADVLLLPSIIEGLPGVILEAFFSKTPVVAYNTGGIKEILINDKTGRLIEKGDEASFASAIVKSLEKDQHNETMIANAYELATTEYLNSGIADRFLNVYRSVSAAK